MYVLLSEKHVYALSTRWSIFLSPVLHYSGDEALFLPGNKLLVSSGSFRYLCNSKLFIDPISEEQQLLQLFASVLFF